jgi:hypothetical protein
MSKAESPISDSSPSLSDQTTPETDKNVSVGLENADRECVPVDFARKLERARDKARDEATRYRLLYYKQAGIDPDLGRLPWETKP